MPHGRPWQSPVVFSTTSVENGDWKRQLCKGKIWVRNVYVHCDFPSSARGWMGLFVNFPKFLNSVPKRPRSNMWQAATFVSNLTTVASFYLGQSSYCQLKETSVLGVRGFFCCIKMSAFQEHRACVEFYFKLRKPFLDTFKCLVMNPWAVLKPTRYK